MHDGGACRGGGSEKLKRTKFSLLDHRWLSTIKCVYEQIFQEDRLRRFWNREMFFGREDRALQNMSSAAILAEADKKDDDRQKRRKHIALVDTTITDALFWAYSKMLIFLQGVLDELSVWAEQCTCHPISAYGLTGLQYCTRRRDLKKKLLLADPCSRRSCRAPELADGHAIRQVASAAAKHVADLQTEIGTLSSEHRRLVTSDWQVGLTHVESEIQLKCGFWTSLPHLLCVLAHTSEETARQGANLILRQYEAMPQQNHHPLSRKFCGAGTPLREQLVMFAAGTSRSAPCMTEFVREIAAFGCIPVAERSCEGRHAVAKKELQ